MPRTTLGKWSVGLNALFLVSIATYYLFVSIFKILNFDNHWWDLTAAFTFPASTIALFTGSLAVSKHGERSVSVYLSILVGICAILFILLHSLFIND